ncbi:MAG: FHA domain-containing protein [Helcococcus sp.]|nr:FHA domain-containing protein [Helcococcus sp.]
MREILNSIRNFFFYDIVADINLYTILSTILKFIFVFIVLYYIYIIVKLIVLDIGNIDYTQKNKKINRNYLIVSHVNQEDRRYLLENLTKIGRSFSNDIVLESQIVSAQHAEIVKSGDAYYIIDLDSSNGTILNGEIIHDNLELFDGDIIQIADFKLQFVEEESVLNDNENNTEGGN